MILPSAMRHQLYREVLGRKNDIPRLILGPDHISAGHFAHTLEGELGLSRLQQLRSDLLESPEIYLFQTSHFMSSSGMRIFTFSRKRPLIIMYKEITPLKIELIMTRLDRLKALP